VNHLDLSKQYVKVCRHNSPGRSDAYGNVCILDHGRRPRDCRRGRHASHFDQTLERTQLRAAGSAGACVRPPQDVAKTADEMAPKAPCYPRTGRAALEALAVYQPAKMKPHNTGWSS